MTLGTVANCPDVLPRGMCIYHVHVVNLDVSDLPAEQKTQRDNG